MKGTAQRQIGGLTSTEWATPRYVFDPLHAEFGFTLDVCATDDNAQLPRYFTLADDGLEQDWSGERCWMNPPYGRAIGVWCAKAARASALVVGLLPARTDTAWWHDHVIGGDAEIRFLRGRIRFLRGRLQYENKRTAGGSSAPFPSAIAVWRP